MGGIWGCELARAIRADLHCRAVWSAVYGRVDQLVCVSGAKGACHGQCPVCLADLYGSGRAIDRWFVGDRVGLFDVGQHRLGHDVGDGDRGDKTDRGGDDDRGQGVIAKGQSGDDRAANHG